MLPEELLLSTLNTRYPCRELQIQQLANLYAPGFPSPPNLIVHGLEATGKTSIVRDVLKAVKASHVVVRCRQCVTGRHLLERTLAACLDALAEEDEDVEAIERGDAGCGKCDSVSSLLVHLQKLLEGRGRFLLVFDGCDGVREAPPTLLPALARFNETIPNLSIIFILRVPSPRLFHHAPLPHFPFPPYNRDQSIAILSRDPPPIFLDPPSPSLEYTDDVAAEDNEWLWSRFLAAVWDALGKGAARDIVRFRDTAMKLWRPFVQPVVEGQFGTRDFSRLVVKTRVLFQGEEALLERVVPRAGEEKGRVRDAVTAKLPYYTSYILLAAYLASYNPVRTDALLFMKATAQKRRKKGGGTARSGGPGMPSKHRKIPRHQLSPSPFPLERLLAILHALLPHPLPTSAQADVGASLATLSSLGLVLRTGQPLEERCRWRVNVGWGFVAALGRSVGCEVGEYLAGGGE